MRIRNFLKTWCFYVIGFVFGISALTAILFWKGVISELWWVVVVYLIFGFMAFALRELPASFKCSQKIFHIVGFFIMLLSPLFIMVICALLILVFLLIGKNGETITPAGEVQNKNIKY